MGQNSWRTTSGTNEKAERSVHTSATGACWKCPDRQVDIEIAEPVGGPHDGNDRLLDPIDVALDQHRDVDVVIDQQPVIAEPRGVNLR